MKSDKRTNQRGEIDPPHTPAASRLGRVRLSSGLRAERRAERVLKRNWQKVVKLAHSLCRRQSGRMTGKQVRRLIGEPYQ